MTLRPPPTGTAAEVRAELARQRRRQSDAAEMLGIHRQTMWSKLNARRRFTTEELVLLADWLDVPVVQFLPSPMRVAS